MQNSICLMLWKRASARRSTPHSSFPGMESGGEGPQMPVLSCVLTYGPGNGE
jgi:hypothetical protein